MRKEDVRKILLDIIEEIHLSKEIIVLPGEKENREVILVSKVCSIVNKKWV